MAGVAHLDLVAFEHALEPITQQTVVRAIVGRQLFGRLTYLRVLAGIFGMSCGVPWDNLRGPEGPWGPR